MSKQKTEQTQKRTYNSQTRRTQALDSRKGILEAAQKLFHLHGFEDTTIDMIAEKARVSTPYVYALFKSKKGVMAALVGAALPEQQREITLQKEQPMDTAKGVLREAAKRSRALYENEGTTLLTSASVLSPELQHLERQKQEGRRERQKAVISWIYRQGAIKKELNLEQARDIMWSLTSPELYRLLIIERKWTLDAYESWLADLLITAILDENAT